MDSPQKTSDIPVIEPKLKPTKYIHEKSPQFVTYHAEGCWGILNMQGNLNLNFFAEYPKMADSVTNEVDEKGIPTGKSTMEGAGENYPDIFIMVREMQCSVVISPAVAMIVREQLDNFIERAKTLAALNDPPPKNK